MHAVPCTNGFCTTINFCGHITKWTNDTSKFKNPMIYFGGHITISGLIAWCATLGLHLDSITMLVSQ